MEGARLPSRPPHPVCLLFTPELLLSPQLGVWDPRRKWPARPYSRRPHTFYPETNKVVQICHCVSDVTCWASVQARSWGLSIAHLDWPSASRLKPSSYLSLSGSGAERVTNACNFFEKQPHSAPSLLQGSPAPRGLSCHSELQPCLGQ